MTCERIALEAPIGATTYSESLSGGLSGGYTEVWRCDTGATAMARIDAIKTQAFASYGYRVGNLFVDAPFTGATIIGLAIAPLQDDQELYTLSLQFGPTRQVLIGGDGSGGGNQWQFSSQISLASAQTNVDSQGRLIEVGNTDDPTAVEPASETDGRYQFVPKTTATVEKQFPVCRFSLSGLLNACPYATFSGLVGKLNSAPLNIRTYSDTGPNITHAALSTMLVGADCSSVDGGSKWSVRYDFEHRPGTYDWFAVVVAINPKTGQPYPGIESTWYDGIGEVPSGGYCQYGSVGYQIYETADFSVLF
jgi:hypothetical protein